jgi:hypothetical protein
MKIKTIGELKNLIKDMDDDYSIKMSIRTRVPDDEITKRLYPYPFDIELIDGIEYDDKSVSEKIISFSVEQYNK